MPNTAKKTQHRQEGPLMTGDARERMVRNIRRFLRDRGWSEAYLAKRAHIPQRSLNNLMTPGSTISPRITTAEGIAKGLGVPLWALFLEDLPDDIRLFRQLDKLVTSYLTMTDDGRDMVMRAVDLESRYNSRA